MFNKSNERVWQFPIEEEVQFREDGIIFFEECATEMATRVGRHLERYDIRPVHPALMK